MKSVLSVKMLAALALVLLVFGATDGRILSKCELKEQLEAAQIPVIRAMGNKMTVDDLIAKLVCMASASGFNTSYVKAITAKPKAPVIQQLYGVFQLSDQLACDSGMKTSLNVCNMSCSALIDDDITDDIACLKTVISSIKPKPKTTLPLTTLNTILVKECRSVVASSYFAEC
ncbi:lysozyme C, milk isozyme-like [Megalobrama amblycephala]|uniref:lysozyme C, milk isozyme-like n=1 Tax=Megalobrama amblycephala TaxID=75352 RepID=UPI0020144DE5|nr:lysozyme C, milk isozyme-like [Megalobrama amblycephala]XP_048051439.1 lysozyme C, milk isozyme-like [Megalobrama amblycephala]